MRRKFLLALLAIPVSVAAAVVPSRAAEPQSHFALVEHALQKHIVPRITQFREAATALPAYVTNVCETGDDAAREELSGRFRSVVKSWAGIWFLRFGPLEQASRRERLSVWPDPRGVMVRQLREALAAKDQALLAPGALQKNSAAIQGLPALEALITDKDNPLGPGEASAYRCGLAEAIAANIDQIAREAADAWLADGGWKDKLLRPGSDNDTYKEPAEAANEIMKSVLMGLQLVGDVLVKPRLDPKFKSGGAFEKSGLSKDFYTASVASLSELYEATAIESYLPGDKDWVRNWSGGTWRAIKSSDGLGGPARGVPEAEAPDLKELMARISGLRQLLAKEMIPAAGLTVGFNELDGD
jgi:predicted lipoprotein